MSESSRSGGTLTPIIAGSPLRWRHKRADRGGGEEQSLPGDLSAQDRGRGRRGRLGKARESLFGKTLKQVSQLCFVTSMVASETGNSKAYPSRQRERGRIDWRGDGRSGVELGAELCAQEMSQRRVLAQRTASECECLPRPQRTRRYTFFGIGTTLTSQPHFTNRSLIDPDELPFTQGEVFDAARRFMPVEAARELADLLADLGPRMIAARAERRAIWRAAGMPGADTAPLHGWGYPDELLPALASLSPDAEARASRLVEADWVSFERALVQDAQRRAAEAAGLVPTFEQIRRDHAGAEGLAIALPPLPPPTDEMRAAAARAIEAKRQEWRASVERYRSNTL